MKRMILLSILIISFLVVGCSNTNSKILGIFQVDKQTQIDKLIDLIGEPTQKENSKYDWEHFEVIKDFPGTLEVYFNSGDNTEKIINEIHWTPDEYNRDNFNKLAESFKKSYKDSWREFDNGYTYKFYYDQDTDHEYAIHLLSSDDNMMIWTPIHDTMPE